MLKRASQLLVTVAAASLAFAPIAAQANTRAGDSGTVYTGSTAAQPGLGRTADGEALGGRGTGSIVIVLLGAAAAIAGILIVASEDDEDTDDSVSPGT